MVALVPEGPSDAPLALDQVWPLVGRDAMVDRAVAGLEGGARSVFAYGPSGIGRAESSAPRPNAWPTTDGWCCPRAAIPR
jgi:hypothetical protein